MFFGHYSAEATLHEIHDGWQAEQQRVIDEARAARKAAKEAEAAKEAAAKEATALGKTDEKKEEKTPAPKETAKDKEEIIVPVKPLFHQTPDSLLRALAFVVRFGSHLCCELVSCLIHIRFLW